MSDNIVHLDFQRQTAVAPLTGKGKCYHRGAFALDEEARTVQCHRCGASLDAFTLLLQYAQREREWRFYDVEVREAEKRLAELKDEERKVKARTKTAARKDADEAVAAERARTERERYEITQAARDIAQLARRIERTITRSRT